MKLLALVTLNLVAILVSLTVGSSGYGVESLVSILSGKASEIERLIILEYRLPRLLIAMLVGASLAVSGTALQAIFRNPLAEPYILGIASGASLGAIISVVLELGILSRFALAFLTSIAVVQLVLVIGGSKRFRDQSYAILLTGIAIASFLSGLNSLLIYLHSQSLHQVIFWLMGSFSNPIWEEIYVAIPIFVLCTSFLLLTSWNLNALLLGDEHARAVGLNVDRYRTQLILVSSLLTSAAVATSGVIGFVGIIVPHTIRMLLGEEHSRLLPATILFSTAFMPIVDVFARLWSGEIPIGALTAMLGGPFFVYLLWKRL
ncbi:MAG: FecCD family ABC transporter permease [Archaeoglobaceae archaeon]